MWKIQKVKYTFGNRHRQRCPGHMHETDSPVYRYDPCVWMTALYICMIRVYGWQPCISVWSVYIDDSPVYLYDPCLWMTALYICMIRVYGWQPCISVWSVSMDDSPIYLYDPYIWMKALYICVIRVYGWMAACWRRCNVHTNAGSSAVYAICILMTDLDNWGNWGSRWVGYDICTKRDR
jgi:hypothetical protein